MGENLVVRILDFWKKTHSEGIQVRLCEGDLGLTQKGLADLELEEKSTSAIFALV